MSAAETPRKFIEELQASNRKFYEDPRGSGALRDLQQTFPHTWLYVAELLQNAVDEAAQRISLRIQSPDRLVFEHDGSPFTEANVRGLCQKGVSEKGPSTVGFMGIGFKSVFRSFETVQVSSAEWRFRLTVPVTKGEEFEDCQRQWIGAVLPEWDVSVEPPSDGMKCRFVLSKRLDNLPPISEDIASVFGGDRSLLALLARKGIKELDWHGQVWILESRTTFLDDGAGEKVVLEAMDGGGANVYTWLLVSASYTPSRNAVRRFLEHRQINPPEEEKPKVYHEATRRRRVELFCTLDSDLVPVCPDRGHAFAMLPTGVTFPIGLHIQADWLLTVSRRELMQLEGNEWHEEIVKELPRLLRYYLQWVASNAYDKPEYWQKALNPLSRITIEQNSHDNLFRKPAFLNAVRQELEGLAFLPVMSGGRVSHLLTPSDARVLPHHLREKFEEQRRDLADLFGPNIVRTSLIGSGAAQFLQYLGILQSLSENELKSIWEEGGLIRWMSTFSEPEQINQLDALLHGLHQLSLTANWDVGVLPCIPTESGGWRARIGTIRVSLDWDIFQELEQFQQSVEVYAGTKERILARRFQRALYQRTGSHARHLLEQMEEISTQDLVDRWWNSLQETPSQDDAKLIVAFTSWIRRKQPQRKTLIKKVLCDHDGGYRLCLIEEALLAEPYACWFRRHIYPALPRIARAYIDNDPSVTPTEWRTFFESPPAARGRFSFEYNAVATDREHIRLLLGGTAPEGKWLSSKTTWHGQTLQNGNYWLLDSRLPELVRMLVTEGKISAHIGNGLAEWISETPGEVRMHSRVLVGSYRGARGIEEHSSNRQAEWIEDLTRHPWIYARDNSGPYRPQDILSKADLARPDAPVANISDGLASVLEGAGIRFGGSIPNAPAIQRLRNLGLTADPQLLYGILNEAIDEANGDKEKEACLKETLEDIDLLPVPRDRRPVDGASRVSHSRLVRTTHRRSTLGDWVIPLEECDENSIERQIFEVLSKFHPVPTTTTGRQALTFVSWVWKCCPDAERVRRLLPRAYDYIREDLSRDSSMEALWESTLRDAKVFTRPSKAWSTVIVGHTFFDDINSPCLTSTLDNYQYATPGHLGDTLAQQLATARLLKLPLLSTRIKIELDRRESLPVPDLWAANFRAVQCWLNDEVAKAEADEDEESDTFNPKVELLTLTRWQSVTISIVEEGRILSRIPRRAYWLNGTIAVMGNPDEFAVELCEVLLGRWSLRNKKDNWRLASQLTILLSKLDRPIEFNPMGVAPVGSDVSGTTGDRSDGKASLKPSGNLADVLKEVLDDSSRESSQGRGHTSKDREDMIRRLTRKKEEIESQIQDSVTLGIMPGDDLVEANIRTRSFGSDVIYREAACLYEREWGRYPEVKSEKQGGHDIDSYSHPEGHAERKLVRRIEVKGKGVPWSDDEIVEMSDRQFSDALAKRVEPGVMASDNFDYWLYVVETEEGGLKVFPIKNPATSARRFELRAGTWRDQVESDAP